MKQVFSGKFVSAAGALEAIALGCDVAYVKVNNVTTNVIYEHFNDGTNNAGLSTNGADGVVTNSGAGIVINSGTGFSVAAAGLSTSDVIYYTATRLNGE